MKITTEKELYELIRKKELNEVKEIFSSYSIISKQLNHFKTILLYFIRKKKKFDIFKFIFEQQQQQKEEEQQTIDNTDILFYSVEYKNFKAAQLVLNYDSKINNKNNKSQNIIDYLCEQDKLDSENLSFILKFKNGQRLITNELIRKLIKLNNIEAIETILKFKTIDNDSVIKLLLAYKNKIPLSSLIKFSYIKNTYEPININDIYIEQKFYNESLFLYVIKHNNSKIVKLFLEYVDENNHFLSLDSNDTFGLYPILCAVMNDNIEIVKMIFNYARKHDFRIDLKERSNDDEYNGFGEYPLLCAVQNNNIEMVKLLMEYAKENGYVLKYELQEMEWSEAYQFGGYYLYDSYFENAINNGNVEMVKLFLEYAKENNFVIELERDQNIYFNNYFRKIKNRKEIYDLLFSYKEYVTYKTEKLKT